MVYIRVVMNERLVWVNLLVLVGMGHLSAFPMVMCLSPQMIMTCVVFIGIVVFGFWFPSIKAFRFVSVFMSVGW